MHDSLVNYKICVLIGQRMLINFLQQDSCINNVKKKTTKKTYVAIKVLKTCVIVAMRLSVQICLGKVCVTEGVSSVRKEAFKLRRVSW